MRRCARIYFLHNLAIIGHRIECHGDSHVRQCCAKFPELDLEMPRKFLGAGAACSRGRCQLCSIIWRSLRVKHVDYRVLIAVLVQARRGLGKA